METTVQQISEKYRGERTLLPPGGATGQYDLMPPFRYEAYVEVCGTATYVTVCTWQREAIGGIGRGLGYLLDWQVTFRAKVTKRGEISTRGMYQRDGRDDYSEAAAVVSRWHQAGRPGFYGERMAS